MAWPRSTDVDMERRLMEDRTAARKDFRSAIARRVQTQTQVYSFGSLLLVQYVLVLLSRLRLEH